MMVGMVNENDPLRFVSQLFEIAVWPFQAAAKFQAERNPLSDQQYSPIFLIPAIILFIPLCLLISFVATVYVLFAVPFVLLKRLFPDPPKSESEGTVPAESSCDK
jgi:hypothetical protein